MAVAFPLVERPYDERFHLADIVDIFVQYLLVFHLLHHLITL